MNRVVISRDARQDIAPSSPSVDRWGKRQARAYIEGLKYRVNQLSEYPQLGRARRDVGERLSSILYESHVIFFERLANQIRIVRILHQQQDPTLHLRRFRGED